MWESCPEVLFLALRPLCPLLSAVRSLQPWVYDDEEDEGQRRAYETSFGIPHLLPVFQTLVPEKRSLGAGQGSSAVASMILRQGSPPNRAQIYACQRGLLS